MMSAVCVMSGVCDECSVHVMSAVCDECSV